MPDYFIENISPLIQYSPVGAWREGDKVLDHAASHYSGNSSFTVTTQRDATATFNFTGTSIVIGGARRHNHGQYSVTLDGSTTTFNGESSAGDFRFPIFQADNLEPGPHVVSIANLPNGDQEFLDIDFIQWTSPGVGGDSTLLRTVEDTDFAYDPPTAWSNDTAALSDFSNGQGHFTTENGAKTSIKFHGTGITLFGAVGPNQAAYTVSVDDGASSDFNALKSDYYPQQMLYQVDRLSSGDHSLVLTCNSDGQKACSVDYAVVYYTDFGIGSGSSALSKGAIAGIVIGVLAFIALLIGALVVFIRRRRHILRTRQWRAGYATRAAEGLPPTQLDPAPPIASPMFPPAYQPPDPRSRIAAWANQTRQATLETLKVRPPSIQTMSQIGPDTSYNSPGGYSANSPHYAIPNSLPPTSLPFSSPISRNNSLLPPPPPPGSSDSRPSSFLGLRIPRGKQPVESQPDPSFGRDIGNGRKFVDLLG